MMEIDRHIEILLLSNDCVIVPGLGGFMAHHKNARYDEGDQMFVPPLRTLGFNPQLSMSDPSLAQSYADAYDISYPEAVMRVEHDVTQIKTTLEREGRYEFTDIGVLSMTDSGHYAFEPCEAGILSPLYYGLSTFEMPKLSIPFMTSSASQIAFHPLASDETNTNNITMSNENRSAKEEKYIKIKVSLLRNLAVAGVAAALLFFFARPIDPNKVSVPQSTEATASVFTPSKTVAETGDANFVSMLSKVQALSERLDSSSESVATPTSGNFTIVLAYRVPLENAKLFVKILHDNGVKGATLINYKNDNVVVYGSFKTQDEAYPVLDKLIKNQNITDGWIMQMD